MKTWDWNRFNLYTTLVDVARNLWVIFLAGVIGFFGCFTYFRYIRSETYTSQMTISINLSGYTTNVTATSLARTVSIAEILKDVFNSDTMPRLVSEKLGEKFTGKIEAEQMEETNLVTVSVTDDTPMKAYQALEAVQDSYTKITDYVFSGAVFSVLREPNVPTEPANIQRDFRRSLILGMLFILVAAGGVVLLSYNRQTLKNTSDVEALLNTRLFGVIAHEKQFKRREKRTLGKRGKKTKPLQPMALNSSFVTYDFSESFRKMAIKLESLKRTRRINSVMVTSVLENEGKTTSSVNLALALGLEGNKVLLIDADLKKPSVYHFFPRVDHTPAKEFNRYFEGESVETLIKRDPATGVYLLGGKNPVHDSSEWLGGERFRKLIRDMEKNFDFVVIDTPPSGYAVDAEIVSGLVSCAVLVSRQDYTDTAELQDYLMVLNGNTYVAGCLFNNVHEFRYWKKDVVAFH